MICKNCGANVSDDSYVCPKCGQRLEANMSSAGNGGSGGSGGRGTGGGRLPKNFGRIFGIVVAIITIVGVSIIAINGLVNANVRTDNINFLKDNLSVIDENELVLRGIDPKTSFSVATTNSYVSVDIVNQYGNKVQFVVDKTINKNRYEVKPANGVWDSDFTYSLSVSSGTYFTDRDMNTFKKINYTIKREKVADYSIKAEIKDLIDDPNQDVSVGDIVIHKNNDGQTVCEKISSKVGNTYTYESVDLLEVFDDLNVYDEFTIDPNSIELSEEAVKHLVRVIEKESFFDSLFLTTYAEGIENIEYNENSVKLNHNGGSVTLDLPKFIIDFSIKEPKDTGLNLEVTIKPKNNDAFEFVFYYNYSNSFHVDIDLANTKFAVSNDQITEIGGKIIIKGEKNYKIDPAEAELFKKDLDSAKKIMEKLTKYLNDDQANIINYSFSSPLPIIQIKAGINVVPRLRFEGNLNIDVHKKTTTRSGYQLINGQFETDEVSVDANEDTGSIEVHASVKLDAGIGLEVFIRFSINLIPTQADGIINFFAGLNPIAKKWTESLKEKAELAYVEFAGYGGGYFEVLGEFDFNYKDIKETKIIDNSTKVDNDSNSILQGSLAIGVELKVTLNAKVKIRNIPGDINKEICNTKIPIIQVGGYFKRASESDVEAGFNYPSGVRIDKEGAEITYGKYPTGGDIVWKVLKLNKENKTAIILSKEAVLVKPYYEPGQSNPGNVQSYWDGSTLKQYLNSDEFYTKFKMNKEDFVPTTLPFAGNSTVTKGSESKNNRVYVLSKEELDTYCKDVSDRQVNASEYAKMGDIYIADNNNEKNSAAGKAVYWLRNPSDSKTNPFSMMAVNSNGSVSTEGNNSDGIIPDKNNKKVGVRIAANVRYMESKTDGFLPHIVNDLFDNKDDNNLTDEAKEIDKKINRDFSKNKDANITHRFYSDSSGPLQ